jgi:polyisoprenoid-binding protein YceI
LSIDASSLDTNNQERDKHLRSADFFNVQQFPDITFETTRCSASNTQDGIIYQLTGNLTIHGVTKQVSVPLRMLGEGPGPYKDQRTGFLCQIELKRTDFGMSNLLENNLVGDAVGITVSFEGIMQAPGSAPAAAQ